MCNTVLKLEVVRSLSRMCSYEVPGSVPEARKYFTTDAWELVQNVLKMMRETQEWLGSSCGLAL